MKTRDKTSPLLQLSSLPSLSLTLAISASINEEVSELASVGSGALRVVIALV